MCAFLDILSLTGGLKGVKALHTFHLMNKLIMTCLLAELYGFDEM